MIQPSAPVCEPSLPDPSAPAQSTAIWPQLPLQRRQQSLLILAQMLLQAQDLQHPRQETGHEQSTR